MIVEIYRSPSGHSESVERDEIDDTTGEGVQIEPQIVDVVGPSSAPRSTQSTPPRLTFSKSILPGYVLISLSILNDIMHRLGIVEAKMQLIKGGMKP